MADARRFEEQIEIELLCFTGPGCGGRMRLVGNLSLREAGEAGLGRTILGYECRECFRRVADHDCWPPSTPEIDAAHDEVP